MRLFVAAWLPEEVKHHLRAIDRAGAPAARWTPEARWHVTLHFLGEVDEPEPVIEAVTAAVDGVTPPTAHLGRRVERLGASVAAVPVAGLDALAVAVIQATAHLGPLPDARPFRGHVTVARAAGGGSLPAGAIGVSVGDSGGGRRSWTVGSIAVVRSVLGPDHRYVPMATIGVGKP